MTATITETEPILVARTQPKERISVNHGTFWFEYRLRHLEQSERPGDGPYWGSEWALEERRYEDGEDAQEREWTVWNYGSTPEKALSTIMGSTHIQQADSLHALHAEAVAHLQELRLLQCKAEKANLVAANAAKAVEDYQTECDLKYRKKVAKVESEIKKIAIYEDMKAKLKPEFLRLKAVSAKADLDNQDAATRVNLHIDMEFDREPVSDTLQKLLDGGNAVVSEHWMEELADSRHGAYQYIRTCYNKQAVGIKDRYVAWIFNTGKPTDFEMKPDMTAIGSPL